MLDGNIGPDRVIDENDAPILPLAPGELALIAGPADLKVGAGLKGPAAFEPPSELCHARGHLVAQILVESQSLERQAEHVQIEAAGILEKDRSAGKLDRRAAEAEMNVAHGDDAIVKNELPADVVHRNLAGAAGVDSRLRRPRDHQAQVRFSKRRDLDFSALRSIRCEVDLGIDIAGA